MSGTPISRRLALTGLLSVGALSAYGLRVQYKDRKRIDVARQMVLLLADAQSAWPIGQAFVQSLERAICINELLEMLERRIGISLDQLDGETALARVMLAIETDLDRSDIIELQGWVLPYTSAILSAVCLQIGA